MSPKLPRMSKLHNIPYFSENVSFTTESIENLLKPIETDDWLGFCLLLYADVLVFEGPDIFCEVEIAKSLQHDVVPR